MIYRIQLYTDKLSGAASGKYTWEDVWCYKDGQFDVGDTEWVRSANSISSLTFDCYPTNDCYDLLDVNSRVRILNAEGWADTGDYYGFKTEFCGRVIEVTPQMDESGLVYKNVVCEDALGFLQDSVLYFDSNKSWFDGGNSNYPLDIDGDGVRTIGAEDLVKLIVGQHNSTVTANDKLGAQSWKKLYIGTLDLRSGDGTQLDVDLDAQYTATGYELLCSIADDLDAQFSLTYTEEDGNRAYLNVASTLGDTGGTFQVGDNIAQSALETSIAATATRIFPWGDSYAKLKETKPKGVNVSGRMKGSEWAKDSRARMSRFYVKGGLKVHVVIGARNKDYAMAIFTSELLTAEKAKKGDIVLRKYTTKAKPTGKNLEKWYAIPEDAKYLYVYGTTGSGSKVTLYSEYKRAFGKTDRTVKDKYRVDLGFWLKYLKASDKSHWLKKYGLSLGSVTDKSDDTLYYLSRNEDKYGVIEGAYEVDKCHLKTEKITQASSKITSVTDLVTVGKTKDKAWRQRRARIFFKAACKEARKQSGSAVTVTAKVIDMRAGRYEEYPELHLFDRWHLYNDKCGIDHTAQLVRISCDLREPWNADVEFGDKVSRSSGLGGTNGGSLSNGDMGDIPDETDGDDESDEYATIAGELADLATGAAKSAIEKADELDEVSYRIQVDSLAAGQMASEAYDSVHPITEAMRDALEDAEKKAHELTAVKEAQSQTIQTSNALARAVATYGYETEKSVTGWRQTYTAQLDAWASDDPEVQAKIKAAYAKLYGENGTADNPSADSAQGRLNSAKAANVEATAKEAEMRAELASANAYQASCVAAASKAAASYAKAKAAYDRLKKHTKARRKQIDAAKTAMNAAKTKSEKSQADVNAANIRCDEASANYTAAKAALADAEAKVDAASAEVETAMNGIHQLYESTISQTAKSIKLTAKETAENKTRVGELEVTAKKITSDVKTMDEKTGALMKATNMTQTDSGFTWNIVDNTARSDAASAESAAGSALSAANEVKTIVRAYNRGVFVGKYPNPVGALVNADGSFDVINVAWDKQTDGTYTPRETEVRASFGNSAVLNGTVVARNGITLIDTDVHSEGSYPPGHSGSGLFASGVGIMTGSGGSNHGVWSTNNGNWIVYSDSSGRAHTPGKFVADDVASAPKFESNGSFLHNNVGPLTSGGASCGSSTYKWSAVYAEKGTIQTSSRKVKENIEPEPEEKAARLLDVDVVRFDYKEGFLNSVGRKGWYGVIAEDVHDDFPDVVLDWGVTGEVDDLTGEPVEVYPGVSYEAFVPHIIKLCQMQQKQIDDLAARVAALEGSVSAPPAQA